MTVRPDRRNGPRARDKRVVLWHAAVVVDTMNLAGRLRQVLRIFRFSVFTERKEQVSLFVEDESRAVVNVRRGVKLGGGVEDELLIGPLVVLVDLSANDGGHPGIDRRRI